MNRNDQNYIAAKIRTQYIEKQPTELDALRALDAKVKRPALIFGYTFGSIATIVMGAGMSLVMTDIGAMLGIASPMIPGIAVGFAGLAMALVNYPITKRFLASRKEKFAPEVLALSEKIMDK